MPPFTCSKINNCVVMFFVFDCIASVYEVIIYHCCQKRYGSSLQIVKKCTGSTYSTCATYSTCTTSDTSTAHGGYQEDTL